MDLIYFHQFFIWIEIWTVCCPCHWVDMPLLKKSFCTLCSVARCYVILKSDFITNPIFYWWTQKIIQNFYLHLHIDRSGNDHHLSWSFTWCAPPHYKQMGKFACLLQAVILEHLFGMTPDKSSSIIALASEYHFHSIMRIPWLLLFSPV